MKPRIFSTLCSINDHELVILAGVTLDMEIFVPSIEVFNTNTLKLTTEKENCSHLCKPILSISSYMVRSGQIIILAERYADLKDHLVSVDISKFKFR